MILDCTGLAVALATPFDASGKVDLDALRRLVRHQVQGGTDVLIALGTTGESATIEDDERDPVIAAVLEEAAGTKVVVGTGHNATARSVAWTKRARGLGAHGALVVTPYYNKPPVAGIVAHHRAIAAACPGFPQVVYNVPGRSGVNLAPAGLAKVWEVAEVVAVKESSGNLAQIGEVARTLPPGKQLLAGDDGLALPSIAVGAVGLVSVVGNLLPRETRALVTAALAGDLPRARRIHERLLPLVDALFAEPSPIPLKAALELMGICKNALRLPLVPAEAGTVSRLRAALDQARDCDR